MVKIDSPVMTENNVQHCHRDVGKNMGGRKTSHLKRLTGKIFSQTIL